MDLNNLSLFNMANTQMAYLTKRQQVLATNIANANTPDYLPQDVEKPSFANVLRTSSVQMAVTNEKHLSGLPSQSSRLVLEDQLNEASKTKSDYNRMLTIYGKYKTMLQTANTKINI